MTDPICPYCRRPMVTERHDGTFAGQWCRNPGCSGPAPARGLLEHLSRIVEKEVLEEMKKDPSRYGSDWWANYDKLVDSNMESIAKFIHTRWKEHFYREE